MYVNAMLEASYTSCDKVQRTGDSLAVTEVMYAICDIGSPTYFMRPSWHTGYDRMIIKIHT